MNNINSNKLELAILLNYKDGPSNEVIEYDLETYGSDAYSAMEETLNTIEFTINRLKENNAFSSNIKEIYGMILNREDHEDGDAEVLEEFSVSFK